jgi:hypothetical protein
MDQLESASFTDKRNHTQKARESELSAFVKDRAAKREEAK